MNLGWFANSMIISTAIKEKEQPIFLNISMRFSRL
jgi:hypothetical protein